MDISSEMVINLIPLFLSNVLGIKTNIIGLIEGVAESTASILKLFSGWLSDKLRARKWLAVAGYGISALAKPFFYFANSWGWVAGVRWADRVGKGIRTAPRDALVADSISEEQRGMAFGFHRAADTAGAMVGLAGRLRAGLGGAIIGCIPGTGYLPPDRTGKPGSSGSGGAGAGHWCKRCKSERKRQTTQICLQIAWQAIHDLYAHRGIV